VVRADGSAENILLKLNGGIDFNGAGSDPAKRDNPPALANDIFPRLRTTVIRPAHPAGEIRRRGYHPQQVRLRRRGNLCQSHRPSGFNITNGPAGSNNYDNLGGDAASFLYHDPEAGVGGSPGGGWPGGEPRPPIHRELPIPSRSGPNPMAWDRASKCSAITPPMASNPEGAGGRGAGSTQAVEMNFSHNEGSDDWWMSASVPKPSSGTIKYKIGIFKQGSVFVVSGQRRLRHPHRRHDDTSLKSPASMPKPVEYFPAQRLCPRAGCRQTLRRMGVGYRNRPSGGFHVLRARAFLKRDGNLNPAHKTAPDLQYLHPHILL
jgi:hypothetical protein